MSGGQGIAVRLVRPAEHRVMPWKNGLGTTAEIAVDPPGSDVAGGFRWRLSIASVERSCAFSAFPGYERTIMVIEGRGMELRLPDLAPRRIDLYEPFVFPGDHGADCTLIDGPIRDFNLMVDRARLRAQTHILTLAAGRQTRALAGTTAIVHCLSGAAELALADDGMRAPLAAGDTAILEVEAPRDLRLDLSAAAPCTLAAIAIHPL